MLMRTVHDVTGNQKSKMAATKPKKLLLRLLALKAAKFQRQPQCLRGVQAHDRMNDETVRRLGMSEIKDGGH